MPSAVTKWATGSGIVVLLSIACLFILPSSPASAEWREIGAEIGPEGFRYYVDPAALPTEHVVVVTVLHLRDYKAAQVHTPTGHPVRSMMIQADYDCHLVKERIHSTTFFDAPMATGAIVATESRAAQWQPILPHSVSETVWKAACR